MLTLRRLAMRALSVRPRPSTSFPFQLLVSRKQQRDTSGERSIIALYLPPGLTYAGFVSIWETGIDPKLAVSPILMIMQWTSGVGSTPVATSGNTILL